MEPRNVCARHGSMMDRHLRLWSPPWAVPLLLVGLAGSVWLTIRWAPRPLVTRMTPREAATPRIPPTAMIAAPLTPRPSGPVREFNWLPSLVDDTRTILTGFALEATPSASPPELGGPDLISAGPERPEARQGQAAPWYPQTQPAAVEEPPRLLIVPPEAHAHRSQNLELIAREADLHSRRGFELASRGAYFSARAEFIMALRLVAQGLDTERHARLHCTALSAGLTALKEAEDFLPKGSGLEADLDLASMIVGHRTPVLHGSSTAGLTPMAALQCYFTFAQEQLGAAVDREVAGSIALYGLGKLHKVLSEQYTVSVAGARPKAMVFYQAALLVNVENHLASNDLGVLLAQAGRYEDARMALEHSLALHQGSTGWHNLAMVYQQLGQGDLARRAAWLAQESRQKELTQVAQAASGSQQPVAWVDPQAFAQAAGQTLPTAPSAPAQTAGVPQPAPADRSTVARSLLRLPNNKK